MTEYQALAAIRSQRTKRVTGAGGAPPAPDPTIGTVTVSGTTTPNTGTAYTYTVGYSGDAVDATYVWELAAASSGSSSITGANTASPSITFNDDDTYTLTCTVSSLSATDSPVSDDHVVTSTTAVGPTIGSVSISGLTTTTPGNPGTSYVGNKTGTEDIGTQTWTYQITGANGGTALMTHDNDTIRSRFAGVYFENEDTYTITLTVTGTTASDSPQVGTLVVEVKDPDLHIGHVQIRGETAATLNVAENYGVFFDGNATGISYVWTVQPVSGGSYNLINQTTSTPTITFHNESEYVITCTITGTGNDSPSSQTIQVKASAAPATNDHFDAVTNGSHPDYWWSIGLHSQAEIETASNGGTHPNNTYDPAENALRLEMDEGTWISGSQVPIYHWPQWSTALGHTYLSWQWEVKIDHTGMIGGKTQVMERAGPNTGGDVRGWEFNYDPALGVNASDWQDGLLPFPQGNPPVSGFTSRVYIGDSGYPYAFPQRWGSDQGNTIIGTGDISAPDAQTGGDTEYYRRDLRNTWDASPRWMEQFGGVSPVTGLPMFQMRTGIWYRFTASLDLRNSDRIFFKFFGSCQEHGTRLIHCDYLDDSKGFPIERWWNPMEYQGFKFQFNNSSTGAAQQQFLWLKNLVCYNGSDVPTGEEPKPVISNPQWYTTQLRRQYIKADFTATTSVSASFGDHAVSDADRMVAILTLENAAGVVATFSDNKANAWTIQEMTSDTEANRIWIATTDTTTGKPQTITVDLNQTAGLGMLTTYVIENGHTIAGVSSRKNLGTTDQSSDDVTVSKQAILFGGFVGTSVTSDKYRDDISIETSPQNWYLVHATSESGGTFGNDTPRHKHGYRVVFNAGVYNLPLLSTEAEDGVVGILALEAS